jgi:hypothetical protein
VCGPFRDKSILSNRVVARQTPCEGGLQFLRLSLPAVRGNSRGNYGPGVWLCQSRKIWDSIVTVPERPGPKIDGNTNYRSVLSSERAPHIHSRKFHTKRRLRIVWSWTPNEGPSPGHTGRLIVGRSLIWNLSRQSVRMKIWKQDILLDPSPGDWSLRRLSTWRSERQRARIGHSVRANYSYDF